MLALNPDLHYRLPPRDETTKGIGGQLDGTYWKRRFP